MNSNIVSNIVLNIIERRNKKNNNKYLEIRDKMDYSFSEIEKNSYFYPFNIEISIKNIIIIYDLLLNNFDLFISRQNYYLINLLKIIHSKNNLIKELIEKVIMNQNKKTKILFFKLNNIYKKLENKGMNYIFRNFLIKKNIENDNEIKNCPICLEEIKLVSNNICIDCKHNFHKNCLYEYIIIDNNMCPICRKDILNF
jgi:hypothetical protein